MVFLHDARNNPDTPMIQKQDQCLTGSTWMFNITKSPHLKNFSKVLAARLLKASTLYLTPLNFS